MALPAIPPTADQRSQGERINRLIREYNRNGASGLSTADSFTPLYAADTGSSTAYAIAPIPGITRYIDGQIFTFKAAHANTSTTPTLAVNGLTAGTITGQNSAALVAGDIAVNGSIAVQCTSTTPTFQLLTAPAGLVKNTSFTATLGADVALNNVSNYFDGPSVSVGTTGTWFVSGQVTTNSLGPANQLLKLWDGTTLIATSWIVVTSSGEIHCTAMSGVITNPAGNLRISVRDSNRTDGVIYFNHTGFSQDSVITAVRIA